MKRMIKCILLVIVILAVAVAVPNLMDNTNYSKAANEAEWSEINTGGTGADFTILEIVPYKGMAEVGYLIGGQEPVNNKLFNNVSDAAGDLSFLGEAISVYPSYTVKNLPSSGNLDTNWKLVKTFTSQDGYFEAANSWEGATYSKVTGTVYVKAEDGSGSYKAELKAGTELENVYYNTYTWEPVNYKNVNAYFECGKPSGVALFSSTLTYGPYSVTKVDDHKGDYDYDCATGRFILNKGKGTYNVIFTRVSNGTNLYYMRADYDVVEAGTGTYSVNPSNITYSAQAGGNYKKVDNATSFTYTNDWTSKYRFVAASVPTDVKDYQEVNGKIYVRGQKALKKYECMDKAELVNNEWFKRYTLGIPASKVNDYKIRVVTMTPDDLNQPGNEHYIDEANMFYINADFNHNRNYLKLYEYYNDDGLALSYKYFDHQNAIPNNLNFAVHDLSWDNVIRVFKKAAGIGCNKAAMVFDSTFYLDAIGNSNAYSSLLKSVSVSNGSSKSATLCNLAKLYIMVYQRNMVDFYNAFLNQDTSKYLITKVTSTLNKSGSTGSFIRPDSPNTSATADEAIYWNGNTFIPFGLNAEGKMVKFSEDSASLKANGIYNYDITAQTIDLTNNVLSIHGMDMFTSNFIKPITLPDDSQQEAVIHLNNPDGTPISTGNITLADLNNVITDGGSGYQNTGGVSYPDGGNVEGPPATVLDDPNDPCGGTEEGNTRNYKCILNIEPTADFEASDIKIRDMLQGNSIRIVHMTSTQFNGNIGDINMRYDLIYMGSGAGRFNNSSGDTVFNDTGLNKYIYFTTGDKIAYLNGTQTTQEHYCGNDISDQRKEDMNNFLAAGYPIILDSKLYQLSGVNNTNVYSFIKAAKLTYVNKNLLNQSDYYSTTSLQRVFLNRMNAGLNVIRPIVTEDKPVVYSATDRNYTYVDPNTEKQAFTIGFSVNGGSAASDIFYNAYLYFDLNGDGIFDSSELYGAIPKEGGKPTWTNIKGNDGIIKQVTPPMVGMNGAYHWKVIVKRLDSNGNDTQIRGAISGYEANTNKRTINILQIRDDNEYNLETKIKTENTLINKYAGAGILKDYDLNIKSMTVAAFNDLYKNKPYTTEKANEINPLARYNLLIFSNPNTAISSEYGALQNIKDEIKKDLSVVFTKDALGFVKQSTYSCNTCFLENPTYNRINNYAIPNPQTLYIYNGLQLNNGNLSDNNTYQTTYVTKTNEGVITRYPYQISNVINIFANQYSNDATIDFKLSGTDRLVGWYCLSDRKDPVVRALYPVQGEVKSDLYKGMYSSSPNDVKNNYYLFNNGLCYYMGINLNHADRPDNDDEMKLFVNTLIAACKSSNRVALSAPVIQIKHSKLTNIDSRQTITIEDPDFQADEFYLPFTITGSSSKMALSILYDNVNLTDIWNHKIYEQKADGSLISEIAVSDNNTNVDNNSDDTVYIVKIPKSKLKGQHIIKISASNGQGLSSSTEVSIIYSIPPVITIEKPDTSADSSGMKYCYVDMDWADDPSDPKYDITIVFKVSKATTNVKLGVTDSGAVSLIENPGVSIHTVNSDQTEVNEPLDPNLAVPGEDNTYSLHLPMLFMKNQNSRKITITATDDYGPPGSISLTLLRRSLFPLK